MKVNSKENSIGKVIRNIQNNQIVPVYALCGNEFFLQDFFINILKEYFLERLGVSTIYSLGDDSEDVFLSELSAISLFGDKKLIIVRQVQKLTKSARRELSDYMKSPDKNICIILILDQYDNKKSIQKYLESNFLLIDVRVPFNNKIKEWVSYIIKQRNYKIESGTIEDLVSIYGDSISHVINEMDKLALMSNTGYDVTSKVGLITNYREYPLWKLQDSFGNKKIKESLSISHSLISSGVSLTQILINLTNLFMQLLWIKMGKAKVQSYTYTGLNKIITNNLIKYSKIFSISEIKETLLLLKKTDIIIKTTSINNIILLDLIVYSVCENGGNVE